jgi:hypothetical protein
VVAGDPALQALFATWDAEADDRQRESRWRDLARQARTQRGAERLLWALRRQGERLLTAAQPGQETAGGGVLKSLFAPRSPGAELSSTSPAGRDNLRQRGQQK